MFRYLGFKWNAAHSHQAGFALQLEESIQRAGHWRLELSSTGLRVYTVGSRPGVNGAYPLLFDQGVVLGRLFRGRGAQTGNRDVDLSASESSRILKTDGRALVDDYWGRYVAFLQRGREGTFVLRDPSGTLPCFRKNIEGVAIVFSWLEDLIAFTPGSPACRVDWEAVAALMTIGNLGGRATAVEGVSEIVAGEVTPLQEGAAPPVSLWSPVAVAKRPLDKDPHIAAERLRQVVVNCAGAWSSCYDDILLRLSGGLDSAILLGSLVAARSRAGITCLNYHSPGSDSDERSFARMAADKVGVELIERQRDANFRLDGVMAVNRTPTPDGYVGRMDTSGTDAEIASEHGALAMFTGAGGDQLFFQLRCTWPAADYLAAHGVGRGFARASLDAARLGRVSLWQAMRNALVDQRHRSSAFTGLGKAFVLTRPEALLGVRQLERYIHPGLREASELPIGKFFQVQQLINSFPYYDPYIGEAAPELVNPLLSQPLIELCLALPTWVLTHGGRGRALARQAFARELPRAIATRHSKGGMEELVRVIFQRNLPLVRSVLLDGLLVQQGLLDRQKLEAALAGRLSASAAYIGEIHFHLAIEAWLRRFDQPVGC